MEQSSSNENERYSAVEHIGYENGTAMCSKSSWPHRKDEIQIRPAKLVFDQFEKHEDANQLSKRREDNPDRKTSGRESLPLADAHGTNSWKLKDDLRKTEQLSPPQSKGLAAQLEFQKGRLKKACFIRCSSLPAESGALNLKNTPTEGSTSASPMDNQKRNLPRQRLERSVSVPMEHEHSQLTVKELAKLLKDKIPMLQPEPLNLVVKDKREQRETLAQQLQKQRNLLTKTKLSRSHSAPLSPSESTTEARRTVSELVALLQDKLHLTESEGVSSSQGSTFIEELLRDHAVPTLQEESMVMMNPKGLVRSQSTPLHREVASTTTITFERPEVESSQGTTNEGADECSSNKSEQNRETAEEMETNSGLATNHHMFPYDEVISGNRTESNFVRRENGLESEPIIFTAEVNPSMSHHPFDECATPTKMMPVSSTSKTPEQQATYDETSAARNSQRHLPSSTTEQTITVVPANPLSLEDQAAISKESNHGISSDIPSEIVLESSCQYRGEAHCTKTAGDCAVLLSRSEALAPISNAQAVDKAPISPISTKRQERGPLCLFLNYKPPSNNENEVCRFFGNRPPIGLEYKVARSFHRATNQRYVAQSQAGSTQQLCQAVDRLSRLVDDLERRKARSGNSYDPLDAAISRALLDESSSLLSGGITAGSIKKKSQGTRIGNGKQQVSRQSGSPPMVSLFHGS